MALTPTIPTSFVPKQPVSPTQRPRASGSNIFLAAALFIVGIALAASAAVYLYSAYLTSEDKSKAAQVNAAEAAVNPATVQSFIKLRDRLTAGETLLNQHIELSQFFTLLSQITLANVEFTGLTVVVNDDRTATITMAGNAKDFNALAAESTAIGAQSAIKSAIFSGISINKDGTVGFTLSATLDPSVVVEGVAPTGAVVLPGVAATSTADSAAFTTVQAPTATTTASTSP